jgi:UDP-N-acetyl-L-fucosamine synthase
MTSKLRLVTFLGTRPEIIRLSKLIPLLDETFDHVVVHTGQNYDPNLSDVFFSDLNLRSPDLYLNVSRSSLGASIADVISKAEGVLLELNPEAVVVLGDTNSALAAFIARRLSITTYHLEAGNRSFDPRVPEEVNRRLLDHTCDFNLPYSRRAYDNLIREGLHPNRICLTGSPMPEVIAGQRVEISASTILEALGLERGSFIVASVHREENVDNRESLGRIISALEAAATFFQLKVVLSTHPRTERRLDEWQIALSENIYSMPPFGLNDYLALQENAFCVVSDSGSVSEESAVLGFPAVTIRDSMERQEALDFGKVLMSGLEPESLVRCISEATRFSPSVEIADYSSADFSSRVIRYILSTIHRGK